MLKKHSNPYGYKKLLVYQKAEELQAECRRLTAQFPRTKTMADLADQMDRSARSVKQNIVEGWKRNSTDEYHTFLGFSIAANAELEEDCKDIWNEVHHELRELKGVMGERGTSSPSSHPLSFSSSEQRGPSGVMGERGTSSPSSHSSHFSRYTPLDIEKLKFFPLDKTLPPVVRLFLRCREINFLIEKLQKSLADKMRRDGTMSLKDKIASQKKRIENEDSQLERDLIKRGLVRLPNGQIVEKGDERV